ncbi:MAG: hypothetical protein LBF39_00735 [Prevotellaceae bacterium]|jgi:hypothetical protein|nr:hypothetical protein [Prevotellaceae bacterium]
MKTTKTKQFLFLAAFCCMAASVAAQTVDVTLQCGQSYTINSTVAATAATGLTYRWLENGSPVTGVAASYTVPATKSVGVYTYIRQAKTTGCTDWQNSNAFTVEVISRSDGFCIAGITWARYNVDVPGSFTTSPDDLGMLYKWDSLKYYSPYETIDALDPNESTANMWSAAQNPCPVGWRVPTVKEWESLFIASPSIYLAPKFIEHPKVTSPGCDLCTVALGPEPASNPAVDAPLTVHLPCQRHNTLVGGTQHDYMWNQCGYWTADTGLSYGSGHWSSPYFTRSENYESQIMLCPGRKSYINMVRCVR